MNIKKFAIIFTILFSFSVPWQFVYCGAPKKPSIHDLTPEDIEALEEMTRQIKSQMTPQQLAEYETMERQMQDYVSKLSPEEQEQLFNQALDEIVNSPAMGDFAPPQPMQPEPVAPTPVAQQPAFTEIKEEPTKVNPKQDAAIRRIDSIIYHTNEFLKKINAMIEFPGKLKKWSEQNKIKGWKKEYKWTDIKAKIENLVTKLSLAKRRNTKTGAYPYINIIVENESLYNNLGKLQASVSSLEPKVEIEAFGATPATRQVREDIRKLLGVYAEALFDLKIPQDLDKAFEKIKPEEAKLLEQEKKASEKAIEESKKPRSYKPTVVSGQADEGYSPSYSSYSPSSYSPSYSPYSDYSSPYSSSPSINTPYSSPAPTTESSSGGSRGSGGGAAKGSEQKEKEAAEKKASSGDGQAKPGASYTGATQKAPTASSAYKAAQKEHKESNPKIKRLLDSFGASIFYAEEAITESDLKKLNEIVFAQSLSRESLEAAQIHLPRAIKELEKAKGTLESLAKLHLKKASRQIKAEYKKEIEALYKDSKKTFDATVKQIKEIKDHENDAPDAQKREFLGKAAPAQPTMPAKQPQESDVKQALEEEQPSEDDVKKAVEKPAVQPQTAQEALQEIDNSFSIYRLQNAIEQLEKTIKEL